MIIKINLSYTLIVLGLIILQMYSCKKDEIEEKVGVLEYSSNSFDYFQCEENKKQSEGDVLMMNSDSYYWHDCRTCAELGYTYNISSIWWVGPTQSEYSGSNGHWPQYSNNTSWIGLTNIYVNGTQVNTILGSSWGWNGQAYCFQPSAIEGGSNIALITIVISNSNFNGIGEYSLNKWDDFYLDNCAYLVYNNKWYYSVENAGSVTITENNTEYESSGCFSFVAKEEDATSSITVSGDYSWHKN